jgi:oligopeptide transport system substrate-binding protein
MMFNRWLFVFLAIITFSSCSKHTPYSKKEPLNININRDPATLDPRKGSDVVSSALHFLLFEGLTRLNDDSSISLAQAESIEISSDRKTYTFHIRNCTWSDGSAVTADDFAESWKAILSPHFPAMNAPLLYPIKNAEAVKKGLLPLEKVGIKAVDQKTLMVELEKPTPYFLQLIAFCVFFPIKNGLDNQHPEWSFGSGEHFICNGPFFLKKWKHNDEIILEKNPRYWEAETISLPAIRVTMVENEMTALHLFENQELDILGAPLSPIPIDSLVDLAKQGLLLIKPTAGTSVCAFNTQEFPFSNAHMRKAFAYAIDRTAVVLNITQLGEQVALSMIPPALKNHHTKNFFKDHDIELAKDHFKKGLLELGISKNDLKELTYCYTTTELNHKIAQALQQQWFDVLGVEVKLENVESKILLDRLSKRRFTFAQTLWLAQYNDPMDILERYKLKANPKNYAGWEHPQYISLLDRSAEAVSSQDRFALLEQAEELFLDEMPIAPIFHWSSAYLVQPYIKNLIFSPIGTLDFSKIKKEEHKKT